MRPAPNKSAAAKRAAGPQGRDPFVPVGPHGLDRIRSMVGPLEQAQPAPPGNTVKPGLPRLPKYPGVPGIDRLLEPFPGPLHRRQPKPPAPVQPGQGIPAGFDKRGSASPAREFGAAMAKLALCTVVTPST